MISKLPRWVWYGSAALTFGAGMINAIGFLSFQHQGVTHLTGSTTMLGIAAAHGDFATVRQLAEVTGAFLVGCIASGALIKDSALKLGRSYGVALAAESALLFSAVPLLAHASHLGALAASCACGLQNGMAGTYSGAVLRTTHVSGSFTDLGVLLGQKLRGLPADSRRIRLCAVLIGAFFLGGVGGAIGYGYFGYSTLYFPAACTGAVGVAYAVYRRRGAT